ncbi:MAG: META domain-containing protein [Chitinophagales bacterium]|nr:META domain-containing protein [Chitinophagales bacterium]
MKYAKAILLLPVICGLFLAFSNDAMAQKKKKTKVHKTAQLENTHWALYEMNGKSVETPADSREVYIKLIDKKSKLEGYSGCNLITGTYDLGKETLTFEPEITERACTDMTTEKYVLTALNDADRYEINGLHLLLFKGTYLLGIFKAKFYDE